MNFTLLRLSKNDYYHAAKLYLALNRIWNCGLGYIWQFMNRFGLGIFPLLHYLFYNSKTLGWILLKVSKDDY